MSVTLIKDRFWYKNQSQMGRLVKQRINGKLEWYYSAFNTSLGEKAFYSANVLREIAVILEELNEVS